MALGAGGIVTADEYGRDVEKIIARGRRTTTSGASTGSAVAVLRIDGISLRGGYLYAVATNGLALDSTVNADIIRAEIRYTTDGSSADAADAVLPGAAIQQSQANNAQSENGSIWGVYPPGSDETLSVLLCVRRIVGTGNATIFADANNSMDLLVINLGEDPGDTGVDL